MKNRRETLKFKSKKTKKEPKQEQEHQVVVQYNKAVHNYHDGR